MKKHSVNISGHQTSVTLEDEFWAALKIEAQAREMSLNALISEIDTRRDARRNLSSAVRVYILQRAQGQISVKTP